MAVVADLESTVSTPSTSPDAFISSMRRLVQYWTDGLLSEEELQAAETKLLRGKLAWDLSAPSDR